MKLKHINWTIAILIIITNIFFIPINFKAIKESGGPMGFGLLTLPLLLPTNLLLIPAGLAFKEKFSNSFGILILNGLGLLWNLLWLSLIMTTV